MIHVTMTERPDFPNDMEGRKLSHSQNFLKNPGFVRGLIEKANINEGDYVVEIGSGKGIITLELSKTAGRVIGVEIDSGLARNLRTRFSKANNVEIIEADFLTWELPKRPYKVFANIPFNMTADIVNRLLSSSNPPEVAYLIMQDKAAGRFMGPPFGSRSQISTSLQPFYDMDIVVKINRREFSPVPNINAVLARFQKKENPLVSFKQQQAYRDFVVYGYNQWKPTLTEALEGIFSRKQLSIMERSYHLRGLKPSEVDVEQWMGIFDTFMKYVPDNKKKLVIGAERRQKTKQAGMQKEYRTRNRKGRRKR